MIKEFKGKMPKMAKSAYVDEHAFVIGEVTIEEEASVWPGASLRADVGAIYIGKGANVQDCAVIHNTSFIAEGVSVGHGAIVHGAKIEKNVLIGMGAIVLDGAEIGENSIVGAGSLVTGKKKFEKNSMILGSPAKVVRKLTDEEIEYIKENAREYVELLSEYKK